ncbi:MAG TPA: PQQ-binding-like beta-propeller repeat protein [Gemmataceae bacterium]|nr:PQQ-binding-like beta-propeller repeat protein [Gemmataceae bacterium]
MIFTRRACVVAVAGFGGMALLAVLHTVHAAPQVLVPAAQVQPAAPSAAPEPDREFTDAITLPTDRQVKKQLEAASEDYIQNEAWSEAARLLQRILDSKEDIFVQVSRRGASNQGKVRWVSAKSYANELLGTMPKDGLPFYELQYGSTAKKLLNEAIAKSDPQILADVAQRYFHTEAGALATDLLGTYHLDRGQALMAALCYERLLEREGADQLSPLMLFKAALAFHQVGDKAYAAIADRTWKRLAAKIGRDGLMVGDLRVSLDQLRKELDRAAAAQAESAQQGLKYWAVFRGNASRSARGRGSDPFLESKWQMSMLADKLNSRAKEWVEKARQHQQFRPEPMLPAFFPVAAGGKLIYRSYAGIHAVDIKTGELLWDSIPLAGSLDALAELAKHSEVATWFNQYLAGTYQNILFENSTVGTLSTDGSRVYAVDDLAIPPYPGYQTFPAIGPGGAVQMSGPLHALAQRSRLIAFDLDSGKLVWEHGDPGPPEKPMDKTELADSYFLGPPLPLGGKLYVLTEKNAELRLVCLDAASGEPAWMQTLATVRDRLLQDVSRRVQAVHLAYGEGIMVCPTNAGAILGIDLLSRSLVWAFPYREKTPESSPPRFGPGMQRGRLPPGAAPVIGVDIYGNLQKLSGDWKMSAPIIQDGKVVFTAPDGGAIHCLNLRDGTPLWQAERRDDLYLAGVFGGKVVLVGKSTCRALRLADGRQQLWQVETGLPSGQGVASGPFYYLPLKKGEVCKIDLEQGIVVAHSPSPKNDMPGNLVFFDGDVVSQTETAVTAYPQVDAKVAEIDARLGKDPKDPVALTERGELRLYQGKLTDAVADLRTALTHSPPTNILPKAKNKLYLTLTELLRQDFHSAEPYLKEYQELCQIPVPDGATAEERQKCEQEQRRRQAGFLCLLADGREKQGRLMDAFQAYLDFGALAEAKELVTVINEPAVKAQPDVWAQGRIAALVAKASPEQRKALEKQIAARWETVEGTKNLDAMRRFVKAFGSLFRVGRQARLLFAERLLDENLFIEAEMHLLQLYRQKEDTPIAAQAVEALARLMARKGLMDDAAYYYRILGTDFANVVIRDGKTGVDLFRELATDKRFLPYLEGVDSPLTSGNLEVMQIRGSNFPGSELYPYEPKGEMLPFLHHQRLVWTRGPNPQGQNLNVFQLKVLDKDSNEERWTLTAPATRVTYNDYTVAMNMNNGMVMRRGNVAPPVVNPTPFPYYTKGHLAVLYLGQMIYGVDLVDLRKLWEVDLLDLSQLGLSPQQPWSNVQHLLTLDAEAGLRLHNAQGITEPLGQIGPVTASYVCLRTQTGLVAVDPIDGSVLWTKTDVSPHTYIFGDDEYVYLIDVRDNKAVGTGRALRGRDGASVAVPDFAIPFQHRQRIVDGRLLVLERDSPVAARSGEHAPTGGGVLHLYDVHTGQDLWKKELPPDAVFLRSEDPELAGVVDPDGTITVADLRIPKEVFHAAIPPADMAKVNAGLLLQDSKQFYVILNRPAEANPDLQGPFSNVNILRSAPVNGTIHAFDRQSGERNWYKRMPNQMLLLERFSDLPMMLFTAKFIKMVNGGGYTTTVAATVSINKRTGKLLLPEEAYQSAHSQGQYFALAINRRAGTYDLIAPNMMLRHFVADAGFKSGALKERGIPKPARDGIPAARESGPLILPPNPVAPPAPRSP